MKYYTCIICGKKIKGISPSNHKVKIFSKNKIRTQKVLVCCSRSMREITKTIYKEP